ncbi:MAG: hypothetical protein KGZ25_11190, partial [Planctomycetes bacterium]|nr:hypothetical protein [Planctomycetota bacterium]
QGRAVRVAGAPGISYVIHAVKDEDYEVRSFLPKKFSPELRDLIAWPARLAGARRVAAVEDPITEIVRYDKPGTAVLIIIDHDARPKEKVTLRIPECGAFHHARTATGKPVEFDLEDTIAVLRLPLETCEAIVLSAEKNGR